MGRGASFIWHSTWPIGLGSGTPTIVSTFYTCAGKTAGTSRVWSNRGQLAYTVIAEEDVSIALCGGEAVSRQDTIYAGSGQPISFTVWLGEQISFLPAIFVNGEPALKLWPDADGVCTLTVTGDTCIGVVPEVAFDSADIVLPNDLTCIEAQAFAGTAVYAVEIPSGCTFIGDRAFADCLSLTRVRIPADCALGEQVFENCRFPVYLYGPAGGTAEAYCQDPDNDTCVFIAEEAE